MHKIYQIQNGYDLINAEKFIALFSVQSTNQRTEDCVTASHDPFLRSSVGTRSCLFPQEFITFSCFSLDINFTFDRQSAWWDADASSVLESSLYLTELPHIPQGPTQMPFYTHCSDPSRKAMERTWTCGNIRLRVHSILQVAELVCMRGSQKSLLPPHFRGFQPLLSIFTHFFPVPIPFSSLGLYDANVKTVEIAQSSGHFPSNLFLTACQVR